MREHPEAEAVGDYRDIGVRGQRVTWEGVKCRRGQPGQPRLANIGPSLRQATSHLCSVHT
jgi:hypothetical protein